MPDTPGVPEDPSITNADEAVASVPEGEAAEATATEGVVEAAEIHANEDEETPVIDVHAPHGGVHTWKDFWIHLGTITAGLLIAISLEQSVEAMHRLHQRHQLEGSLRAECEVNKERAEADFSRFDDQMRWLLGLHEDIGRMLTTGGNANLPFRQVHFRLRFVEGATGASSPTALSTSVWDAAAADNRVALLPDDEARSYFRLYRVQGERFSELRFRAGDAIARQAAFEARFADIRTPTKPVLARMSAAELKEYDELVMQTFTAFRVAKAQLRTVYGTNDVLRQGLNDSAAFNRAATEAATTYADDYVNMAQEIDAEDAVRDKAAGK
jgi:hypothetical protein